MPRVIYSPPAAAFYAFFKVDGVENSLNFAKRLATKFKVGVARERVLPGRARLVAPLFRAIAGADR